MNRDASPTVRSAPRSAAVREWISYAEKKPELEGVYEWRMPSVAVDGLTVRALAWFRKRGAGLSSCLSPTFDHWDGYRVSVPTGLEWRDAPKSVSLKVHETSVCPEVGAVEACRHCGSVPSWKSVWRASFGGAILSNDPHRQNMWWLSCCSWGGTPHMADPRKLVLARRKHLGFGLADRTNEDRTEQGEETQHTGET